MLSQSQSVSVCQSFRPVAPFFFLAKVPFLAFKQYRNGCGHIDMLMTLPLVTLILNNKFVGLTPLFFLAKKPFLGLFFLIQKGVWPYGHAHDIPLVTLTLNIYGFMGLTSTIQA